MFRLLRNTIILITIFTLGVGGIILATRNSSSAYCVQITSQTQNHLNIDSLVFNSQTGQLFHNRRPILPPDNWPSPDGKYAAFWWKHLNQEAELYLASTTTHYSKLIYRGELSESNFLQWDKELYPRWKWSHDSITFGYVGSDNGQIYIGLIDAVGNNRRILPVPNASSIEDVYINGWSVDGHYLAANVRTDEGTKLFVWLVDNLSFVSSSIRLLNLSSSDLDTISWSPTGHRLALSFVDSSTETTWIGIWSPEHGIEVKTEAPPYSDSKFTFDVTWAPDEGQILTSGVGEEDITDETLWDIQGNSLVESKSTKDRRSLLGWSRDGWATVIDSPFYSYEAIFDYQLLRVHSQTTAQHLDDIWLAAASPDGKRVIYVAQQGSLEQGFKYSAFLMDIESQNKVLLWDHTFPPNTQAQGYAITGLFGGNIWWSPDNRYVYLVWSSETGVDESIIASVDGKTIHSELPVYDQALWLANEWVSYIVYIDEKQVDLYVLNLKTGYRRKIDRVTLDQSGSFPYLLLLSPSPNGQTIVNINDEINMIWTNTTDIYKRKTNAIDTTYQPLKHGSGVYNDDLFWTKYTLAWSPDSSMFAYLEYNKNNSSDLVILNRKAEELKRLPLKDSLFSPIIWTQCD